VPVDYEHGEFYFFSAVDATKKESTIFAPAFEFNYGVAQRRNFMCCAFTCFASTGNPAEYGIGDMQLGIKYVFSRRLTNCLNWAFPDADGAFG